MASQQLHFIIGMGRSGTTILSKLLNRYSEIHALPEINFFTFFFRYYSTKQHFTTTDIELFFKQIEYYVATHYTPIWQIQLPEAKQSVINELAKNPQLDYVTICKLIFKQIQVVGVDKSQANILLHKSPITTLFANKIISRFPQTKFIWIVRDYRASLLSLKQSIHSKSSNIAYNATRWNSYNQRALELFKKYPNNVLLIKYEDLVCEPTTVFQNIEQFLGITNQYEKTNFEEIQLEKIMHLPLSEKQKERYLKKHTDLQKPLNTSRVSVWKEQLSLQEIEIAECICNTLGSELHYMPTTSITNYLKKISFSKPIIKAKWDICKEYILFYLPVKLKLNRLKTVSKQAS